MSTRVRAAVQVALLGVLLTGCSFLGFRPTPTPPQETPTPVPSTASATAVLATAATGTIYPQTFNPNATPTPVPPATPFPTAQPAGIADLVYAVMGQLGRPDWCDPDFYPLPRGDEVDVARGHLDEMRADAALYRTILEHNGISPDAKLTDDQLVAVYSDWKVLTRAIVLAQAGANYSFDYVALRGPDAQQMDYHVAGTITPDGQITTSVNEATSRPNCPICLARGTLIAAPQGPRQVEELQPGTIVWTQDGAGSRIAAPILEVGTTPVPPTHEVVHLVLADGRTLDVSPGHPLTDGRSVGQLRTSDAYDGSTVVSADLTRYVGGATFDLLPAGLTGYYWANGILMGSTLSAR